MKDRQNQTITVIGGANIDIQGAPPVNKIIPKDSNPGIIKSSLGGVGRNIAENCARLGLQTKLITAVGDDKEGMLILKEAKALGIDTADVSVRTDYGTSTYLFVLDEEGELLVAIADMAITSTINEVYIKELLKKIDASTYTVIDANLSEEVLKFLADNTFNTKLVLDTVSISKAVKAKAILGHCHMVKMNMAEAGGALLGLRLDSAQSVKEAISQFLTFGVREVVITMGGEGAYYCNGNETFLVKGHPVEVVNATGAGDAFMAGIFYGLVNGRSKRDMVQLGMAAAEITLVSSHTNSSQLSVKALLNKLS